MYWYKISTDTVNENRKLKKCPIVGQGRKRTEEMKTMEKKNHTNPYACISGNERWGRITEYSHYVTLLNLKQRCVTPANTIKKKKKKRV